MISYLYYWKCIFNIFYKCINFIKNIEFYALILSVYFFPPFFGGDCCGAGMGVVPFLPFVPLGLFGGLLDTPIISSLVLNLLIII